MKNIIPRRAQRGAVFVEAIVVLSFFVLCFLGVVFFREVYVAKLRVQRLARASAMAHAMGACSVDPKAGLEKDLPNPPAEARAPGTPLDLGASGKAKEALDAIGRTQGGAPLAENTAISVNTTATAITRKDVLSQKQGFETDVASSSFVTCMDPVSDGDVGDILPRMESIIESFF